MRLLKRFVAHLRERFGLRDRDIILREYRPGPWYLKAWIVKDEAGRRRVRFSLPSLLSQLVFSRCTRCGGAFSIGELAGKKRSGLIYFQSGSICHRDCTPSQEFLERTERNTLRRGNAQ